MNLVVWGAGKDYIEYKHLIKNFKYTLVDSNQDKQGAVIDGKKVESPYIINKMQYDYIVISSRLYFDEIYDRLNYEFSISGEKIIPLFDIDLELIMREIGRYNLSLIHKVVNREFCLDIAFWYMQIAGCMIICWLSRCGFEEPR